MKPTIEEVRQWLRDQTEYDCGNELRLDDWSPRAARGRDRPEREIRGALLAALDVAEALTDSRFWTNVVSMCPVTQELRDRAAERLQESASRTNDAVIAFAATIATRDSRPTPSAGSTSDGKEE